MTKKVLIIGANSPTAIASANIFLRKKYEVHLISRNILNKQNQKDIVSKTKFYKLDLEKPKNTLELFNSFKRKNISFDTLIFFQRFRGRKENFDSEINVSVKATKDIITFFSNMSNLKSQRSITVISSAASDQIAQEQSLSYHVSKAAIDQLIRYFAYKLGKRNIRVNGIRPALVYKERARKFYEDNPEIKNLYERVIPLRRMGSVKDIANLAYFLSSNKSSYLTGQIIKLDGGISLHESGSLSIIANSQNNN
jgi:NAD(P)-dependent dehydrogenase (short-subunit alcohol dehydrogenase family)